MQSMWNQLERQVQQYIPDIQHLRPGAGESTLRWVEHWLSVELPEEMKAFYRVHDGQHAESCLVDGWSFFSLKGLCSMWLYQMREFGLPGSDYNFFFRCSANDRYPAYWHPYWLPFMGNLKGPLYCVDLAPGPEGTVGQILFHNIRHSYYYDPIESAPSIRIVASSIHTFMERLLKNFEDEEYRVEPTTGLLMSKNLSSKLFESIVAYQKIQQGRKKSSIDGEFTWEDLEKEYRRGFHEASEKRDEYLLFEERIVREDYPDWSFPVWQPRSV